MPRYLKAFHYGSDPVRHRQSLERFLRFVDIVGLGTSEFEQFAEIRGHLRRTGQIIGDLDILIGVTAVEHGLTIVTRNVRHFERIPNIMIYETKGS
jgi:tRNA(fMet)-specific endonuclease VapC